MSENWFRVKRGWRDHPLFRGEHSRAEAWLYLIEAACWKPTRVMVKGTVVELGRGELSFSQRFLADKWGWSKSRVDRFIAELRANSMIETRSKIGADHDHKAGQGQSILTVCNYDKYQGGSDEERGNSGATSGATAGQQRGKEEEGKKERIEGSGAKAPSPRARPPEPFPKPEWADAQVWADFMVNRKAKRCKNTETAYRGFLDDIAKHTTARWTPAKLLEHATAKGWGGIYAPREEANGHANGNGHADRRTPLERALDRRLGLDEVAGEAGRQLALPSSGDSDDLDPPGNLL